MVKLNSTTISKARTYLFDFMKGKYRAQILADLYDFADFFKKQS